MLILLTYAFRDRPALQLTQADVVARVRAVFSATGRFFYAFPWGAVLAHCREGDDVTTLTAELEQLRSNCSAQGNGSDGAFDFCLVTLKDAKGWDFHPDPARPRDWHGINQLHEVIRFAEQAS